MTNTQAPLWLPLVGLRDRALGWSSLPSLADIDPYLAWADATKFGGAGVGAKPRQLPFLIRLSDAADDALVSMADSSPTILHGGVVHLYEKGLFVTGDVITKDALKLLPDSCINVNMPLLPFCFQVDAGATLALPRVKIVPGGPYSPNLELTAIDMAEPPLLAVIDDGCPFAHAAYRRSGKDPRTRVIHFWDQNSDHASDDPVHSGWQQVPGFDYGREIDGAHLDALMKSHRMADGAVDEYACYRGLGLSYLDGAEFTHGAHVLGLVAGAPNPAPPSDATRADAADQAEIIFVQLPRETMGDTSGGALARHVLDALRYVDLRATREKDGKLVRRPVVINLSVGAAAGPHDGTSLAEQAVDSFVDSRPACAVLVAAGNARGKALHAEIQVPARGRATLNWQVATEDGSDSFLELWLSRLDDLGEPPQIAVKLVPPDVDPSKCPWVDHGTASFMLPAGGKDDDAAVCGVVSVLRPSNSGSGHVVLCAVAPTGGLRGTAEAGIWKVELSSRGETAVDIDAWIERDDPTFGGPGRQSQFDESSATALKNSRSLSSLAHGHTTIVIGGYRASPDGLLDPTSGEGPGRLGLGRLGPDLIAPSDESPELPGLLSYGVHSGQWNRLGGTSVATAFATRRLYNDLHEIWDRCRTVPEPWDEIKKVFKPDKPADSMLEPPTRTGSGRLTMSR